MGARVVMALSVIQAGRPSAALPFKMGHLFFAVKDEGPCPKRERGFSQTKTADLRCAFPIREERELRFNEKAFPLYPIVTAVRNIAIVGASSLFERALKKPRLLEALAIPISQMHRHEAVFGEY